MGNINRVYITKFKRKLRQFNRPMQLPDYFAPMLLDKKKVVIAELGAGPINTIGNYWEGIEVEIHASDNLQPEYQALWREHDAVPIVPVEYQDFEHLTYPDETFDIVHCVNALDHTPDLYRAVREMRRVCKRGGWVYFRHSPGQKTKYGGKHYHDFETVALPDFSRYIQGEQIVNIWRKT